MKPLSLALMDLNYKVNNHDFFGSIGIMPVWRRLWLEITITGGKMDFIQTGFDDCNEFAFKMVNMKYNIVLINIDNFVPDWVFTFVPLIHKADKNIEIVLCGFLPTIKSEELSKALPLVHRIISGPLESSLMYIYDKMGIRYVPGDIKDTSGVDRSIFRDLFLKDSAGMIQASAGCPMSCSFCRYSSFYHSYYEGVYNQFPMESIVSEILELNQKYHISHIQFTDSNFLGYGKMAYKRADELAASLQDKGLEITFEIDSRSDTLQPEIISRLVQCGLRCISIGVESMSPNQLERYGKKATVSDNRKAAEIVASHGILIQGYSILADPLVTREELLENLLGLYELSEKVLILINEKMILYSTTNYYKKYCDSIPGLKPIDISLGVAFNYEFRDKWCKENFEILLKASQWLKYKTRTLQMSYKPLISGVDMHLYVKKATSCKIELLMRIVNENYPNDKQVMLWCNDTLEKIKSLLINYNELKVTK